MGIQDFGTIEANASLKQVINALADLQDTLNFLLNGNLDVKNVRAQSITADRLKVQQLSAIAADLGKVIAGILIGAYISTADGTYPRIDFSSSGNLLAAYADADTYLAIVPQYNSVPALVLNDAATIKAFLYRSSALAGTTLGTFDGEPLNLQASGPLNLNPLGNLQINNTNGYSGSISYVKNVVSGAPTFGSITVTKGIITNVT